MAPVPPTAKRVPHSLDRPGAPTVDDWFWLRDRDDPDTLGYLEAENRYAEEWFAPLRTTVDRVFGEIKARTQETDASAPVLWGGWWYQSRTVEGLDYEIHVRRAAAADHLHDPDRAGPEIVLMDENVEAGQAEHFDLGVLEVSPSHRWAAWSADRSGAEVYELRVRDLASGADLPDRIERTSTGVAWSADERFVFYSVPDEVMRPHQIWRHEIGTPATDDVLVHEEADERYYLDVSLTRSGRWLVISAQSMITSEVWVLPADDPCSTPRCVEARSLGHLYSLDHHGDRFVILTNHDAEDFRVVLAPVTSPGQESWVDLVPHRPGTRVTAAAAFAEHVAISEWSNAQPGLQIVGYDGTRTQLVFDEQVYRAYLGDNPEFETQTLRFDYESLTVPGSVIDHDVRTGVRTLRKQDPVLGGYDPTEYDATREWATAPDGTTVPVEVVWRKGTPLDGSAPCVLYGYGSYEHSVAPWFSVARLSLLDRGVVWALAHPRGGGELGRRWYLDGKLLAKRNTFTDFLACADHLVREGYSAPDRLAARGGSAGGLLVGAALTMRPDRFRAVVAEVPFVDVVTTMLDTSLPLTSIELDEWGDPSDPEHGAYMASYSPYDNVQANTTYPWLYVTAGLNDPRVSYHEPAKFVAKLRALSASTNPIVLRTETGAGHLGPSGRYDAWKDEARVVAFLLHALGVG